MPEKASSVRLWDTVQLKGLMVQLASAAARMEVLQLEELKAVAPSSETKIRGATLLDCVPSDFLQAQQAHLRN